MLRIASALLFITVASSAQAQTFAVNDKPFRVQAAYVKDALKMDISANNTILAGEAAASGFSTSLNYQINDNLFAGVSYGKGSTDEFTIDGQSFLDDSNDYTSKSITLGYRIPRGGKIGEYWGIKAEADMSGDEEDDGNIYTGFTEKDTTKRYGNIGLSIEDDGSSLSGTHVWFLQSGIGVGIGWGFGAYETTGDVPMEGTQTSGALVLMYRP